MKEIHAENRSAWHKWLKENYQTEKEIFLIYYKNHTGSSTISYDESVEEAICFGWIDGIRKKVDDNRYKIRFTPRKTGSIWSLINRKRAEALIEKGLMTEEGIATIEDAKKTGQWDAAYSLKGETELPADFKTALNKNKKALENFDNLSNTNKFSYIYQINAVKNPDNRAAKIEKIIRLLEQNIKPYINGKLSINIYD